MLVLAASRAIRSSRGTTVCRKASDTNQSAAVFCCSTSNFFLTSYKTIVGTMSVFFPSTRYGSNKGFFVSAVKYSSQPEESTSTRSEAVVTVTIVVFPLHPFGDSRKVANVARSMDSDGPIENVDLQFLTRRELQLLANRFRDHQLKFWGQFYGFHRRTPMGLST